MSDRIPSAEDVALAEDLRSAVGNFVRATRARADALPPARAAALGQLERDGEQTIAQLASARGVRHQGMSRTVAELEELGLVVRRANPVDARGWVIALSEGGRNALNADRNARRDVLATRIAAELGSEDRELLERVPALLRRLTP